MVPIYSALSGLASEQQAPVRRCWREYAPTGRSALCGPHGLPDEVAQNAERRAGPFSNARVRRGMIRLMAISHIPDSALAQWLSPHRDRAALEDHDRGLGAQASDRPVA
jgi:hypothetical protein